MKKRGMSKCVSEKDDFFLLCQDIGSPFILMSNINNNINNNIPFVRTLLLKYKSLMQFLFADQSIAFFFIIFKFL
jgi:hypothetical protein